MNKEPTLIAVLVVIFIFGIQLLVFESYQTHYLKTIMIMMMTITIMMMTIIIMIGNLKLRFVRNY